MDYFLTKERLEELQAKLEQLKTVARTENADRLKRAKELGDLSENAEYIEAKREQERIEREMGELEEIIQNSILITKGKSKDVVDIGSTVELIQNGKKMQFSIVGGNEAKPEAGLISNESPIGRELINKRINDIISIDTPRGKVQYKIDKIT